MLGKIETYHPPEWAATLSYIPKKKVHLAMTNTPIHPWKVPGVPEDFTVSVKRDDLTGCALSGNKVRKLEFLLADALHQGCRHVITSGGPLSNHCRTVALCARQLGLTPHLFLSSDVTDVKQLLTEGNMLLSRLCGAHMYVTPFDPLFRTPEADMKELAQQIQSASGESSYIIPGGGTNKCGLFAYIDVFEELIQQGVLEQFDDLFVTCGSTGTMAALGIANYLTGGHLRLHAAGISKTVDTFYDTFDEELLEVGLGHLKARDLVRIVDGRGNGFGQFTDEELDFIQRVMVETSVPLDPNYTGKAAFSMVKEMQTNPSAFKGRRVLFIHTGGLFGLFHGQIKTFMEKKEELQPRIRIWPEN
ncbi:uncharacterized protein LOC143275442 [Babylonia areolata]|uniref:uncharacterized protein LOC143275442 n=1 Tax=Babylonia areolata TaxID=304850 RepID=UPI003FCF2A12